MIPLSRQFLKNVSSHSLSFAVRICLTFIFIPIITSTFGEAKYGVWAIIFQIISYFAVFDFGLHTALTRFVSKYLAQKEFKLINRTINTANLIYSGIGLLVFVLVYFFTQYFFHYLKIDDPLLIIEGKEALIIMGLYMAFNFIFRAYGGSLGCFQREDLNRFLIMIEEIIRYITLIVLLKLGHGLVALAWAVVIISSLRFLTSMIILKLKFPTVQFSLLDFNQDILKKLLNYSTISFGISLGWVIMFSTDNFLLGMMSSVALAGIYAPGAQLMLYFRNIVNNIGTPLIPAISHLEAEGKHDKIKEIYYKNIRYTSFLSATLLCGTYFYAQPFVNLWLSDIFAQTAEVMIILSLGTAFFIPQILNNSILFGIGKHKYILITVICEAITKLALAFILVPKYGLLGMAWSNSIAQIFFYATLYPYLMRKAINISLRTTLTTGLKSALTGAVILLPLVYFLPQLLSPSTWSNFGFNIVIYLGIFLLITVMILLPEDRTLLKNFFTKKRTA